MSLPCNQETRINAIEEQLEHLQTYTNKELADMKQLIKNLTNGGLSKTIQEQNEKLIEQLMSLVQQEKSNTYHLYEQKMEREMQKWKLIAGVLGSGFGLAILKLIEELLTKR